MFPSAPTARFRKACAFALVFSGLLLSSACFEEQDKEAVQPSVYLPSKVSDYLTLGLENLTAQQMQNGFFSYEFDFITGAYTNWDNIIYQTEAGYAMAEAYLFLIKNSLSFQRMKNLRDNIALSLQAYKDASLPREKGALFSFYYNKRTGLSFGEAENSPEALQRMREDRLQAEISATAFAFLTELIYFRATGDNSFENIKDLWKEALIFHTERMLSEKKHGAKMTLPPAELWYAFSYYANFFPEDTAVLSLLEKMDPLFYRQLDPISDFRTYTWMMMAASLRLKNISEQKIPDLSNFVISQTQYLIEKTYAQHDTRVNTCEIALGLVEASQYLTETKASPRVELMALARSQLEFSSSLKFFIVPGQTWISLGPGRTLHSQDFKRFTGAFIRGMSAPQTSIALSENCILASLRFMDSEIKDPTKKIPNADLQFEEKHLPE